MIRNGPDDDKSIIRILENRAGEIVDKRVKKKVIAGSLDCGPSMI
jgi:hypothetical protein